MDVIDNWLSVLVNACEGGWLLILYVKGLKSGKDLQRHKWLYKLCLYKFLEVDKPYGIEELTLVSYVALNSSHQVLGERWINSMPLMAIDQLINQ